MQFSPLLKKTAPIAVLTARSRSKSPKMIRGLLPPNSKEAFFKLETAQDFMMVLPTGVEPVNPSLRTSGWSAMACPASKESTLFLRHSGHAKKCKILTCNGSRSSDYVDDSGRNPSFMGQFGELKSRQGTHGRRFDDHRVACSQASCHFPGKHHQRVIPGSDQAANTDRLASSYCDVTIWPCMIYWDGVALNLVAPEKKI